MIDAKNCPIHNCYWYDVTDIATGRSGRNSKICVNLDCHEDCNRTITNKGLPLYDPHGKIANSYSDAESHKIRE